MLGCVGSQGFWSEQAAHETCPHGVTVSRRFPAMSKGMMKDDNQVQILMCAAKTGTKPKTEILSQSETGIIYL